MFDRIFIEKLKRLSIFIIIFTLLFILFFKTMFYTLPFILAFIIALCTRPLMKLLKTKLRMNSSIAALLSTIIVFSSLLVVLTTLIYKVANEAKQILATMPNIENIKTIVSDYAINFKIFYEDIDPSIIQKVQEQLTSMLSSTFNITTKVLNSLISFAAGLPLFFLIILVVLFSTYFFTKDLPDLSKAILSMFSQKFRPKVKEILFESGRMLGGYVKAYSFIMSLTFIQILIGFLFLRVKYALLLSIFCWILDLVPVLGISIVFIPLVLIYALSQNYFVAIGLLILWLIVSLVRQILEPKIVSSSLDLHPLAVLAAIFIGITAYGFLGMLYILGILVFYKILKKVNII
jgi:sporulation integral membrane protein YtvI